METTLRAFKLGLYDEHLDEISFLRDQCHALRGSRDHGWLDLAPFEARLEAHLDGLVIGGDLALEACREAVKGDDSGRLFGAVCVYCRHGHAPLLADTLRQLEPARLAHVEAVTQALQQELPVAWGPHVAAALVAPGQRWAPLLSAVAGHRRLAHGPAVFEAFLRQPSVQGAEALGRLGHHDAVPALAACLLEGPAALRAPSLLALLRAGSDSALRAAAKHPLVGTDWHLTLAISAGPSATPWLMGSGHGGRLAPSTLLALGLLGDPGSLRVLYDHLEDPELAPVAAQAMQWLTGGLPDAPVFVPEDVDEQALSKKELDVWHRYREAPQHPDGRPFGEWRRAAPTTREAWKAWFVANPGRFDPALRYRHGEPVTPAMLLETLRAAHSAAVLRRAAALELEVRYGCDVPFEIDLPVLRQAAAIERIAAWVAEHGRRFEPGRWFLHGRPVV